MLDSDLAELYGITTGNLNKAVKRNIRRFPDDFMFQLSPEEYESLKFQIGIANEGRGGRRVPPYVFTEQGVAMLSSVLHTDRAIDINVSIMRAFVRLRELLATHKDVVRKLEEHDRHIASLYAHVERLLTPPEQDKNPIGFDFSKDGKD
ncbi:MAG: ORF6N domain-containing protein [Candidatus Thiodiazotropha sp.]